MVVHTKSPHADGIGIGRMERRGGRRAPGSCCSGRRRSERRPRPRPARGARRAHPSRDRSRPRRGETRRPRRLRPRGAPRRREGRGEASSSARRTYYQLVGWFASACVWRLAALRLCSCSCSLFLLRTVSVSRWAGGDWGKPREPGGGAGWRGGDSDV
jgi:hypothetical protein